MNWLNFTLKIEQNFVNVDKNFQKTKEGHDFAAKIILGHAKKLGSKLVSLAHSSFLEEGYIQRSPHNKGSRDYIASNDSSGDWHTRKINVKKLLEETHGISWSNVIIFFTDSNNTGQKVITYYRDVYFSDWKISHTIAIKNLSEEDSKIKFLFQPPNEIEATQKTNFGPQTVWNNS